MKQLFLPLLVFLPCFLDFEYFSVILGSFLTSWKIFEIQDGGCFDIMSLSRDVTSSSHVTKDKY